MSSCDRFRDSLGLYLDGEAGDQEESIRAHVNACEDCHRIVDGYRRVSAQLRDLASEEPALLVDGILKRVRRDGPPGRRWSLVPRVAAAAAVFLAALLWGWVLLGDGKRQVARSAVDGSAAQLADLAGGLTESEQQILFRAPPTDDELLVIVLAGGRPR